MALVAPPTIGNKQALSQRGEHELIDSIAAGMDSISGSNKAKRTRSVPMAASLVASSSSTSSVVSSSSSSSSSSSQIASMNPLIRTVNPGDRVNIPCSIANTGGSIQFAKDDQPIILDSGCAHCQLDISNDGQASLTINRVSHKNQGDWQCWSLDSSGKVKQKIPIVKLIVTNSPELPILIVNDKELMSGNNLDTITVKENEIINFRCVIRGATSQVDYVHWMLDSSQNITHLSQLMMEYSPQDNNYLIQSLLKLNATKSMNLKSISCLSNHQQWLTPMTVTAFLNVLYEPSFTISREPGFGVPVSEGMSVILKCEIDSNPSSNPIWVKDADNKTATIANGQMVSGKEASGEPILLDTQEDGSVILQPTKLSDSGWYRCKTENKYGNFSSFGYYLNVRPSTQSQTGIIAQTNPPQARVINNQASSLIGQQPNNAARIMAPNQSPKFNGLNGNTNTNNIINNDQPAQQQQHPFAPYQANNNQVSQDQARCRGTKIDGSPEIDRPISTINAVLGRQLTIPLRFCCNPGPARVFWIHRVTIYNEALYLFLSFFIYFSPTLKRHLLNT